MSDFIVIGAGINGLLVARELAHAGARVTVFDRGACARESSWAGGGIVSPLYPWRYPPEITALAIAAQEFYPRLAKSLFEETGIDPEYERTGLLMLDAGDEKEAIAWGKNFGQQVYKQEIAAVYANEPNLALGFTSALSMPAVANIRNPRMCKALVAALQAHPNVAIEENTAIEDPKIHRGRVNELTLVKSASRSRLDVGKSQVVVCGGAWSGQLLKQVGFDCGVVPVKGEMLLYKFEAALIKSIILFNGKYLIPRRDGHLLMGSTLEWVGFDKTVSETARVALQTSAAKLLPQLVGQKPIGQWAGLRPGIAGGLPAIGAIPGVDNLFINAGQFRNGLVLAPASARLLADTLLNRTSPIDPSPYCPNSAGSRR